MLEGFQSDSRMGIMRRGDNNGIDVAGADQGFAGVEIFKLLVTFATRPRRFGESDEFAA
jgi:hypothetical protein